MQKTPPSSSAAGRPVRKPVPAVRTPRPEGSPPVVHLRVAGARGHLTFFQKMVQSPEEPIQAGRIVEVRDRTGAFAGYGFFHPRSQIAVRMITFEAKVPDAAFFEKRLSEAVELRHDRLKLPADTTAYRVCHAEGDGLGGLILDRFGGTLVAQIHSVGMYHRLEWVRPALQRHFPGAGLVLEADAVISKIEGFTLPRQVPVGEVIVEHGAKFHVLAGGGQKTGFYCDQRENRLFLSRLAAGKSVLDLCCYSGGFAIQAARAGAAKVTGVDVDEDALAVARRNAKLNGVTVEFRHSDLFNYLRQLRETPGVIVLDPPKMIREPAEKVKAVRSYHDMNRLAFERVAEGGVVVSCSCSGLLSGPEFLEILRAAAEGARRRISILRVAGAGPDHPVSSLHPEGEYLKAVFSVVRPL